VITPAVPDEVALVIAGGHHPAARLSPEGKIATQKLRDEFKVQDFEPATKAESAGLGNLLRDIWGFDLAESR
jgi:hypothetical protein